jgi:hypothetical protein
MYTWTPTSRTDKNLLQTTIENEDKNTELREREKKGEIARHVKRKCQGNGITSVISVISSVEGALKGWK